VNPGVVLVSITNFGQTGPYKDWLATDIVGVAMGGLMALNGDEEHGPVRTLAPQAYAQVNAQAAVGATIALYARGAAGGLGQHVDVSMQEAVANALDNAQATWDISRINLWPPGLRRNTAGVRSLKYLYPARDGWVAALSGGPIQGPNGAALIDWMAETGEAGVLATPDWREKLGLMAPLSVEEMTVVEDVLEAFCAKRDKVALVEEAQRRGGGWAPVFSPREIVESEHLAARDYWIWVKHEDIGESFLYPGAPWRLSATPWQQRGRAPHLGEHNGDVYGGLLGLGEDELKRMRTRMVV
jgi:benzylsuccinate CoA-transferase BbsE subunit